MLWQIPENEEKGRWFQLRKELSVKYAAELELIIPKDCDEQCFRWFQILEEEDFRFDLRYTRQEIIDRLNNPELLFFFILSLEIPEILVLGYRLPDYESPTFYLDTIAVRQRGQGIGDLVMQFIINRARDRTYQAILLDTEEKDEKGIQLRHFYEEHGFKVITKSEQGDLTMGLDLNITKTL